jgi:lipopolysaccharide/colanic/teichoic acid biosynthesis glycosyltransferase
MTPTSLITTKAKNGPRALQVEPRPLPADSAWAAPPAGARAGRSASLALKFFLDYGIAALLVAASAPLFLVIAALIKLTSPGPVLFVQERVGRGGRAFRCYKFRTMRHNSDDSVHREFTRNFIRGNGSSGNGHRAAPPEPHAGGIYKLTRDPRVTGIGALLRRTSLDELPQLLNVLRGEMSLVGPRPPVLYELEHYQEWHKRRLLAKPGITGLWQVSGRSSVPFDEMVLLDLYYIDHRSTLLDLWIMARTLPVMIKGEGAY